MILVSLLISAQQFPPNPPSAEKILDGFAAYESAHPRQTLEITSTSTLSGHAQRATYKLSFVRPSRLRLEIIQQSSDRIFTIEGRRLTAYDRNLNQFLTRTLPQGSLAEKLTNAMGEIEDPIRISLDPSAAKDFASRMKAIPRWSVGLMGHSITLYTLNVSVGKSGSISLMFYGQGRPFSMAFENAGKKVEWDFSDDLHKYPSFHPPASARPVSAFFERAVPPAYADSATSHSVNAAIHAYDQLKSIEYRVRSNRQTTHVLWQGDSAQQEGAITKWSYRSGILTIRDNKTGKVYKGPTNSGRIPDYLNLLGDSLDPTLRLLLSGRNPIEVLFSSHMKAQTVAQATVRGSTLRIIELSRPGLKIQLQFRSNQKLPVSVGVENLDSSGRIVAQNERNFEYLSENKTIPAQALSIQTAHGALPLPTLKRK